MSNNVQQYDKQVYLRVSEAQRCRVHSTLVVPLYSPEMLFKPIAIFELVQSDKDCPFPAIMSHLQRSLEVRRRMHCAHAAWRPAMSLSLCPHTVGQALHMRSGSGHGPAIVAKAATRVAAVWKPQRPSPRCQAFD